LRLGININRINSNLTIKEASVRRICLTTILLFCISNLYSQVNLDSGLVAYYPFTGNADDSSGNNNHGIVMGAILSTDRFGNDSAAYEFNGNSNYISVANSTTLQSPSNELSQVAWINIYSWSHTGSPFGPILMKSNVSSNAFQYRLSVGQWGVNTAINNWLNAVTISDTLNFNEWYMIASTLKDDTVKVYVNGQFIGEDTLVGPILPDDLPLEIGRDVPGQIEHFSGKLGDIRIYDRMLTQEEIEFLFGGYINSINIMNFNILKTIKLSQNFLNPFNPSTKIKFDLPKTSEVTLTIYNVLGEEVAVLVSDRLSAGSYSFDWSPSSEIASGVYIYRLKAGPFTATKKLVVMK
jgi:hypothetical protein